MKKILIPLCFAIAIGLSIGFIIFNQYHNNIKQVFNENEKIYILQQGVYSSEANVKKYVSNTNFYIIEKDNQYYRVYVAMTKKQDIVDRLKDIYIKSGNDIYVREVSITNLSFSDVLDQYDKLLAVASNDNAIKQIEKQVLSKYEELIIRNE